jgi:hypothetical protein
LLLLLLLPLIANYFPISRVMMIAAS